MIKKGFMLITLSIVFSTYVQAQNIDAYIVINEASWCKYCKANGERIHDLVDEFIKDNQVQVIINDLTDKETLATSKPGLEKVGLYEYMKNRKTTAVVYVFDAQSKKFLDSFTLKTKNEKVLERLNKAIASIE